MTPPATDTPSLVELRVPEIAEGSPVTTVQAIRIGPGDQVKPGTHLVEFEVDFGMDAIPDCPPVMQFRLIAQGSGTIRSVDVNTGSTVQAGSVLATIELAQGSKRKSFRTVLLPFQADPFAGM